jgi:hypothetical protein
VITMLTFPGLFPLHTEVHLSARTRLRGAPVLALLASLACSDESSTSGSGSLSVILEAEDVIIDGIAAGGSGATVRDGWNVEFDKYLATVGNVTLQLATGDRGIAENNSSFVVDLTRVPSGNGLPLWSFDNLAAGRWLFSYGTPGAAHGAERHESVDAADYDRMVSEDLTYWVEARLSKPGGESCPPEALASADGRPPTANRSGTNPCYPAAELTVRIALRAETKFQECELDGVPGFSIIDQGQSTVAITLHGDHLLFNGFPEGGEATVIRRAQFLADCDIDLDGEVTTEELGRVDVSELPELSPERYLFGGAPAEFVTVAEYLAAQLATQGHFQGEGECLVGGVDEAHSN